MLVWREVRGLVLPRCGASFETYPRMVRSVSAKQFLNKKHDDQGDNDDPLYGQDVQEHEACHQINPASGSTIVALPT